MSEPDATGFMWLIREHPDILPPAPYEMTPQLMDRRRLGEVHPCAKCGELATHVIVANSPVHPEDGERWLDLCTKHYTWLLRTVHLGGDR